MENVLNLYNVNPNITEIIAGVIVLVAGLINVLTDSRRSEDMTAAGSSLSTTNNSELGWGPPDSGVVDLSHLAVLILLLARRRPCVRRYLPAPVQPRGRPCSWPRPRQLRRSADARDYDSRDRLSVAAVWVLSAVITAQLATDG